MRLVLIYVNHGLVSTIAKASALWNHMSCHR